jgi:hypothetical protein
VHLPDTVPGAESKRGGPRIERRSSPTRSMALELNGGKSASPSVRGVALGSGEPLGPAPEERGGMRWLCTGGRQEAEGADDKQWGGLLL